MTEPDPVVSATAGAEIAPVEGFATGDRAPFDLSEIRELLDVVVERNASDLHLSVGSRPQLRLDGVLVPLEDRPILSAADTRRLAASLVTTTAQQEQLQREGDIDFSFGIPGLARFRCSVYTQRGELSLAVRALPFVIPPLADLGLPETAHDLASRPRGLVLITGPTGSGKSTTLAALVDEINATTPKRIVTIEDPIEYVHKHRRSLVDQREVSTDTPSFARALRAVIRHDPDVVLIGEMRDLETFRAALTLAETGHLTLGTLHTGSCAQTMHRIVDVFPPEQQDQVRMQLALVLEAIVSQALLPRLGGGRVLATEVLLATPAIRALIRENKIHQIYSVMQSSQAQGMRTFNHSLAELVLKNEISREEAFARSPVPNELAILLEH